MDLQTLSREKRGSPDSDPPKHAAGGAMPAPRRRWATRFALPAVVVLATLALIAYAMRDVILPATQVDVVRARAIVGPGGNDAPGTDAASNGTTQAPATVVAQAPGWVEPDPYPIYATTLADGIVETIHVLEGDAVSAGQLLVELVDDDAALALESARAGLARDQAALIAAQADFDEPVALRRAEAVGRAALDEAKAALARLDAEVAKEQARLAELSAAYDRLAKLSASSTSALQVEAAKYQAQSQAAVVEATRQQRPVLEARVDAAQADLSAAERDLDLKTELRRIRDEATASVDAAETAVAQAQLRLERMKIHSPIDGVVMARLVAPGAKLMLGMDGEHSAHAIHLYQPASLQVRVDVPLADAAAVGVGQRAAIIVDVLPDTEFTGTVTRLVNRADIAKNTVQFKVEITDPSPLLKPDMLARVKFFSAADGRSPGGSGTADASNASGPVAIKRTAVVESDDGPFVWWVTPSGNRLERRAVTLGGDRGDGFVVIPNGLNPGDVVVDHPDPSLQAGQRVRVKHTDH